jgi:diadenosine tetraphosphate (Ap4A) HIT family hydrolase
VCRSDETIDAAAFGERTRCPFCARIDAGELLEADGTAVAFPDAVPVTRGHALVAPRRHVPDLLDLTDEEYVDMWRLARVLCRRFRGELGADGFNLGVNVGPAAGQTVPHVHLHVMPRYLDDVDDPRGGVRWIFPRKAEYWLK